MGSSEKDLEMGAIREGEFENQDCKPVKSNGEMSSVMNGGGDNTTLLDGVSSKVVGLNSKQFRLRRAVSDVRFKAKLVPVLPGKKVRLLAYSVLQTLVIQICSCDDLAFLEDPLFL